MSASRQSDNLPVHDDLQQSPAEHLRCLFAGTVPSDPRAFADPLCSIFSHADRANGGFGYWPVGWWWKYSCSRSCEPCVRRCNGSDRPAVEGSVPTVRHSWLFPDNAQFDQDHEKGPNGQMSRRLSVRDCILIAAAMMILWPLSTDANTRQVFVVIVPQARQPRPPPPIFPAQPPLQWAPPYSLGLTPGRRSPTARCYAGTQVCPLSRPEHVGEACACGITAGRALIPPSHDIAGTPLREN
jgi:hypothetical protein